MTVYTKLSTVNNMHDGRGLRMVRPNNWVPWARHKSPARLASYSIVK